MQPIPVGQIKGVGAARVQQLQKLGIYTVEDLLCHLPRDYHDLTQLYTIDQMQVSVPWFGKLEIISAPSVSYPKRSMNIVRVKAADETGTVTLLWYNQPYIRQQLEQGKTYFVYGRPDFRFGQVRLLNPMIETPENHPGARLLPIYKLTRGLSQGALRKHVQQSLDQFGTLIEEELPRMLRERYHLYAKRDAYELAHFPPSRQVRDEAVRTLSFTELLLLRTYLAVQREDARSVCIEKMKRVAPDVYYQRLDFVPTGAQMRVIDAIAEDLEKDRPMSRLVQGDVGSGKTAVAFYALFAAVKNGRQAAMMAPTELLAMQHYEAAQKMFTPLGYQVTIVRAGMKAAEKREVLEKIATGESRIVIGTHALLEQRVQFKELGVVVADEQHRFGVRQRARLLQKGQGVHALFLSATPIPRTLSMILYGDLDISVLDERPPGRKAVQTRMVPPLKREAMYDFVAEKAKAGQQAYVVCPMIETEEEEENRSVEQVYDELRRKYPTVSVGLLHGKMKQAEKDRLMQDFIQNQIQVLVSTTVIEVGVNVPNATVMVIEQADRFGLAQLHQLRGRVGRGEQQSWCFLSAEGMDNERLKTICATEDGFAIAQADLQQRGPGALLGTEQHGRVDLHVSLMLGDGCLLEEVAQAFDWLHEPEQKRLYEIVVQASQNRYAKALEQIALN